MRRQALVWPLAIACAALAATAAAHAQDGRSLADALICDGRAWREPWRLLTGSLVHATWAHLARDAALVLAIGLAFARACPPSVYVAGLVAPPAVALVAGARGYYGLSGLAYALIAAALVDAITRATPRTRSLALAVAALLAIKLVVEACAPGASALSLLPRGAWLDLGPGVVQGPGAHLAGALAGALAAVGRRRASSATAYDRFARR